MPGIVLAWLTGEGIIAYRSVKQDGHAPIPGQMIAASFVFIACGLIAEAPRAAFLGSALAWGFNIAALMNILPGIATGGTTDGTGPKGSSQSEAPVSAGGGRDYVNT
jgi:hypothetical protein